MTSINICKFSGSLHSNLIDMLSRPYTCVVRVLVSMLSAVPRHPLPSCSRQMCVLCVIFVGILNSNGNFAWLRSDKVYTIENMCCSGQTYRSYREITKQISNRELDVTSNCWCHDILSRQIYVLTYRNRLLCQVGWRDHNRRMLSIHISMKFTNQIRSLRLNTRVFVQHYM